MRDLVIPSQLADIAFSSNGGTSLKLLFVFFTFVHNLIKLRGIQEFVECVRNGFVFLIVRNVAEFRLSLGSFGFSL